MDFVRRRQCSGHSRRSAGTRVLQRLICSPSSSAPALQPPAAACDTSRAFVSSGERGAGVPIEYQCSSAPVKSTWQYCGPSPVLSSFRLPGFDDATDFLPLPSSSAITSSPIQWAVPLFTIHLGWNTELYDSISYIIFYFSISIHSSLDWTHRDAVLPQSGAVKQVVIDHV